MTDLSGQYLGRYYLAERLGEGGMAVVYKAYDTRLERDVAVKIIRTGAFPADSLGEVLRRFEREAKSLAKLSHPNIVKVYDYGEHEDSPFLVMEFLPGGTLKKMLGRPIPWQEAVRLILPVARGVAYAHQRGILHRDIKPANILITESGEPMLSDFGIAKLFEGDQATALTGSGMAIGTPEYMAPEQWTGKTNPQSDLYSLGIVLYEMVTGRKPYVADTPAAILIKQATEPLPNPRKFEAYLPEALDLVLIKALAKDPGERYKDLNAFIHALENIQVGAVSVPVSGQASVGETGGAQPPEAAVSVTAHTPVPTAETVQTVIPAEQSVPAQVEREVVPVSQPVEGQTGKTTVQPEGITTTVSKLLRSVFSKPLTAVVLAALFVVLVCVAGAGFLMRSSTPPLFFSDGVQVYSLKRGDVAQITQTVAGVANWSPVGDVSGNVYFTSDRTSKAEIFGFDTNTGKLWQVTDTTGDAESWSPTIGSGANLYFTSDRTGKAEIFGFNTKTGELWQVTDTPGDAESWSPTIGSGADLYFTSNRTGRAEIFKFNTKTGELSQETDTPTGESWGPILLGGKVYFTSNRSGMVLIYLLGADESPVADFESWTRELNERLPGN